MTVTSKIGQGVETGDASHFITQENIERLKQAKEANRVQVFSFLFFGRVDENYAEFVL